MADKEIPVLIDKFTLGKAFDPKAAKAAPDEFAAALGKSLGNPYKVVSSAPKGEGFDLSGTVKSIDLDQKKNMMSAVVSVVVSRYPGRKYVAEVTAKGGFEAGKPDKYARDIAELMQGIAKDAAKKAKSAM